MKARSLTFYIEPDRLGEVLRVVDELIVPIYRKLPGFVGLVVLRAEHVPRELIGLSVWDGDLARLRRGHRRVQGENRNGFGCVRRHRDLRRASARFN